MIPKTIYLYWGGQPLSWLRFLTVVSFKKHNPDWDIKVYYPETPSGVVDWETDEQRTVYKGKDWFKELSKYAEVLPFDMRKAGMSNGISEVYKSDIFRLWALNTYGGVYSDFDILYTKPLPEIKERTYCYHPEGHFAIGFLAFEKNDDILERILSLARINTSSGKYQSYGSTLWLRVLPDEKIKGWNLPENFVYSYGWEDVNKLFTKDAGLPEDSVGIHWYGGSAVAGKWENTLRPTNYHKYNSTITNIIKEIV